MKKTGFIAVVLLSFIAFNLTSCSSDDDVDAPAVLSVSTGNYWPSAINNQWVFELDGVGQEPMKMVSIDVINGNTYFTFNEQSAAAGSSATTRVRKSGGDYYLKIEDIVTPAAGVVPGSTTSGSETILIKDYLEVGASWTSNYQQTTTFTNPLYPVISMDVVIEVSILEKNSSVIANGVTYNDVIKIERVQTVSGMGQTNTSISEYWFSKDIGPVKITNEFNGTAATQELVSHDLN